MTISKKDLEKLRKGYKEELAERAIASEKISREEGLKGVIAAVAVKS